MNYRRYEIKNYIKEKTFASFLPGIAGEKGIPAWCYYCNRGQAVTSFGVDDKNHAIMEFSPAHTAYQNVSRTGFRTFIKVNGITREAFHNGKTSMHIGMNDLVITWSDDEILVTVKYFILPEETVGALCRSIEVRNVSDTPIEVEVLDGMPAVVCHGVDMEVLKNMTQTAKAWMQAEDFEDGFAYFRVRTSIADTTDVSEIVAGNFGFAMNSESKRLVPICDPELIFEYDMSLDNAVHFELNSIDMILEENQVIKNKFPCCFFSQSGMLVQNEALYFHEVYGFAENKSIYHSFANKIYTHNWFIQKYETAINLVQNLCKPIMIKTGNELYDEYTKQTYLDNVLRGGVPVFFEYEDKKMPFYLYSRKHGDIERDYNFFKMLPEFYSQGNGNYRDINQNRRSDIKIMPDVKTENIHLFYNLIQSDGYNPLVIEKMTYHINFDKLDDILKCLIPENRLDAQKFFENDFTPGRLAMQCAKWEFKKITADDFISMVIALSECDANASFGEGYWTDHFTYNLDLIESYLEIYPENKEYILFDDESYLWYETKALVNPRIKRYMLTANGLRQHNNLDHSTKKDCKNKWMMSDFGNGKVIKSTLIEKLILICGIKFASLDPYGYGLEMEGGKPGWYDALNGLPALFGSSVADACELLRMLEFTVKAVNEYMFDINMLTEMAGLIEDLYYYAKDNTKTSFMLWDNINNVKETYRQKTLYGVNGTKRSMSSDKITEILRTFIFIIKDGISRAVKIGNGICPTYFYFEPTVYEKDQNGYTIHEFTAKVMPAFLEGSVRYMKLDLPYDEKLAMHEMVTNSELYDKQLKMYKVNVNLDEVTSEVGRARAFTRGWLENESVWLHMEYKYLLELLKNGMYNEFRVAYKSAAVPFLNPAVYGRSLYENSSFIVSSVNPDEKLHGRGFVARLSGSTAELIDINFRMFFGSNPFKLINDNLILELKPFIPEYLMADDGVIEAMFLGKTMVKYKYGNIDELIPDKYKIASYMIKYADGQKIIIGDTFIPTEHALKIRDGLAIEIIVNII